MNFLTNAVKYSIFTVQNYLLEGVRYASKKTGSISKNRRSSGIKKHRGWKRQDGAFVQSGTILMTQRSLRLHPGLNVGMGRNGTLYAKIPGKVVVTCERTNLNWDHKWVQRCYHGREHATFFKKHFNIVPEPQHQNFILKEQI